MRELKSSEIETVSGGIMTRPVSPFERLIALLLVALHLRKPAPRPMPQPK
jgi:hypothetical protein